MIKKLGAKQKGEYAELLFAAEAAKQGFCVLFPHGDSAPYDFVLDNGKKLLKIQVKSSSSNVFGTAHGSFYNNSTRSAYTNIDFFAFVELNTGTIYIMPKNKVITKTKISICPKKHHLYKNNWQPLKL